MSFVFVEFQGYPGTEAAEQSFRYCLHAVGILPAQVLPQGYRLVGHPRRSPTNPRSVDLQVVNGTDPLTRDSCESIRHFVQEHFSQNDRFTIVVDTFTPQPNSS